MKSLAQIIAEVGATAPAVAKFYHDLTVAGVPKEQAQRMCSDMTQAAIASLMVPSPGKQDPWEAP
jgi:hypothetical protein